MWVWWVSGLIRRVNVTFGVFEYCVQVAAIQLQHMLLPRCVTGWKRLSVGYYIASLSFGHVVLLKAPALDKAKPFYFTDVLSLFSLK